MNSSQFSFRTLSTLLLILLATGTALAERGVMIEDFEAGTITLESYPDQDQDPGDWELTTGNTWQGNYALRLYGNTWKTQAITPIAVADSTVWQVAIYVEDIGEMQGFGISDGVNELLYTFAGEQLPEETKWWTVYQGAFDRREWHTYLLPIGEDWLATYGYLPEVSTLIYVNDNDGAGSVETIFDAIEDVSEDLPVPPQVTASQDLRLLKNLGGDRYRAGIQFYADVIDPDSESHDFMWEFGDSTSSTEQNPYHEFTVEANYSYTVSCLVRDPDAMADSDTLQVGVELGQGELPIRLNFVGDIMIGRSYEYPGGIIDQYGVDAIFEPTKSIFGDDADVSLANLEVSFTDGGTPHPTKSVVFRARPSSFSGVVNAGIDLVTLGNNHIIDYGEVGMLQTMELCEANDIRHFGAGINDYQALLPSFWTERGVRLAFLGLSNRTGRRWNYQPFLDAGASKPGFAYLLPKNLEESIAATIPQADVVIVTTHSGDEYQTTPPGEGEPGGAFPHDHAPIFVEQIHATEDQPEFWFRNEPTPSERELRRQTLDLGADVIINHHPHVIQGFESYNGKLIAHSLGNFIFDLSYPETMPTIVLTLEIGKEGIDGYTFKPAWIDDNITQPATGQLGREIIDLMADYSQPMGALVAYDPLGNLGRIYLDPAGTQAVIEQSQATVPTRSEAGYLISEPLELAGSGTISQVLSVTGEGLGDYEISFGREILWHGGFEDEGATLWDDNTSDEWLDDTVSLEGERSLALRRQANDGTFVGTDLEKHLPCRPDKRHTAVGAIATQNAAGAKVMARFYSSRTASSPITSTDLADPLAGTGDWLRQWRDLDTPENATYFELRATLDPPDSGEGLAWFDELKFIQWDDWQAGDGPLDIPVPNNYRFIQIRTPEGGPTAVTVMYEESAYVHILTGMPAEQPVVAQGGLSHNYPNPFNPVTSIDLTAPTGSATPVQLAIYDLQGRLVAPLFEGMMSGGERRTFTWNGCDGGGKKQASGVYFSRARFGARVESRKMILLK